MLKTLKDASSLEDLARILGYKPSALSYLVYKLSPTGKYTKFKIPKKSGGVREISAPIEQLKTLQRRLANVLYACRKQIDAESDRRSLSHGFRENHSIITNARCHKRRRYVLNLDLQDFFPTFNFGRVRGFFIKNRDFKLDDKVATIIAQIACHENKLPQGSPSSPIIADLITHLLDVRLVQLARQSGLTYSRYADDLTFSTNQKIFPHSIASREDIPGAEWVLASDLINRIETAGFAVNPSKTRMQCRTSRQLVTGLTVNAKVNIRSEYYRHARAMCHSLFQTGTYHRPVSSTPPIPATVSTLEPIEGILSHIHQVKNFVDGRDELTKKKFPTASRKLYAKFLAYRHFVILTRPLIVCEGKTDNIYLKYAIRKLEAFHPKLGTWSGTTFNSAVSFLGHTNQAHNLLELGGGTGDFKFFFLRYSKLIRSFRHRPLEHPVIVLLDNDQGAVDIFSLLNKSFGISITVKSPDLFFHVTDNLYLVKTPELGKTGKSCIEDFFDPALLKKKLDGSMFNPDWKPGTIREFGKATFAEKIIRPNADTIDFWKFAPLLHRISAAIDHYDAFKSL